MCSTRLRRKDVQRRERSRNRVRRFQALRSGLPLVLPGHGWVTTVVHQQHCARVGEGNTLASRP